MNPNVNFMDEAKGSNLLFVGIDKIQYCKKNIFFRLIKINKLLEQMNDIIAVL